MSGTSSERYAKKGNRKSNPKGGSYEFKGFVNLKLTDADKEHIRTALEEQNTIEETLSPLIEDGYKISLRYDASNKCYLAAASPTDNEHTNAGYTLSARGPSLEGAVAALYYKINVIAEGGSWESAAVATGGGETWE